MRSGKLGQLHAPGMLFSATTYWQDIHKGLPCELAPDHTTRHGKARQGLGRFDIQSTAKHGGGYGCHQESRFFTEYRT